VSAAGHLTDPPPRSHISLPCCCCTCLSTFRASSCRHALPLRTRARLALPFFRHSPPAARTPPRLLPAHLHLMPAAFTRILPLHLSPACHWVHHCRTMPLLHNATHHACCISPRPRCRCRCCRLYAAALHFPLPLCRAMPRFLWRLVTLLFCLRTAMRVHTTATHTTTPGLNTCTPGTAHFACHATRTIHATPLHTTPAHTTCRTHLRTPILRLRAPHATLHAHTHATTHCTPGRLHTASHHTHAHTSLPPHSPHVTGGLVGFGMDVVDGGRLLCGRVGGL